LIFLQKPLFPGEVLLVKKQHKAIYGSYYEKKELCTKILNTLPFAHTIPHCTFAAKQKNITMGQNKTLGKIIEEKFKKSHMTAAEFAEKICCTRNNVYSIFKREYLDTRLLALISKVLHYNFFKDLADSPELINTDDPNFIKELEYNKATSQFLDVIPGIISRLNLNEAWLVKPLSPIESEGETPDMGLHFLTYDSREIILFLSKEWTADNSQYTTSSIEHLHTKTKQRVDLWSSPKVIDKSPEVKLDFKTEEQWEEIISFIVNGYK